MKIALLGSAPSSIGLAPFQDASFAAYMGGRKQQYPTPDHIEERWEIWCCSPGVWAAGQRADRWFEVHRWEPGKSWFSPEYTEFLCNFGGPVYTGGSIPEIKNHVIYPIDEMEEKFGPYFFTSSLALMWALAIAEIEQLRKARAGGLNVPAGMGDSDEDDVIGMWGVDMAATEEYGFQRAGCQFFILEALRRGIKVLIPQESDILRPMPVYGICEWDHLHIKATARARELAAQVQQQTMIVEEAKKKLLGHQGCVEDLVYFINTWSSPYGLPCGEVLRHEPGTGLGAGKTVLQRPPVPEGAGAESRPMSVVPIIRR